MYYEEKWMDGKLYWRCAPDDEWTACTDKQVQFSYEQALKQAADAQATIAALQVRVRELEARQHFGACAKCLTNAWRICKEGTPDAVEIKCSNGSTWWLCDYCLSKEQLTQRTAELEAAKRANTRYGLEIKDLRKTIDEWRAELERVRGELVWANQCRQDAAAMTEQLTTEVTTLRTLLLALPKVEGDDEAAALVCGSWFRKGGNEQQFDAALAALLQHRQGMEG